jgi:outer membrane receptor protein involved in Fe transport
MSYVRRRLAVSAAAALALAVLFSAPPASAQTETGRVTGAVADSTGALLPGTTVTLLSPATSAVRTTTTDQAGRYVFANVQPGAYEVEIELQGFNRSVVRVVVPVGTSVTADTVLQIAGQAETVTVVSESPRINTVNSEVGTVIGEQQIRDLPTITRNVYDLVGTAPNVTATPADMTERGTGFNINGQRSASTNILLDGSANNDEFTASVGQAVPLDSVQEFSVITSNFSAQYGRATGGVVNVATKSGTNQFRGTGYEFYRSDALATNTFDNKANEIEKGEFTRHQTGFSLGGPVLRDRVHFFSNLEYIRVRSQDTLISWVPTPEFLAASSPATRAYFNQYGRTAINGPTLTRAEVSDIFGTTPGAFNNLPANLPVFGRVEKALPIDAGGGDPQNQYQWVNRVDFNLSPNTQAYVRYAWQDQNAEPGTNSASPYEGFDTGYINKNHNLLGSVTHVFSPTFTSQSKIVWNRLLSEQPLNGDPVPGLYMNPTTPIRLQGYRVALPGYLPFNPGSAIPFGGPQQLWQLYQDQTWIKGRHDFRFGGSYVRILDDRTFGAYANAVQAFNLTGAALPSLDNLVLGQLRRFQVAINPNGYPGGTYTTPVPLPSFNSQNKYNEFAFYVNDNWRLLDRLTVNLGLRYEYYGPQTKSEPKYDSNFYYGDPNASVNTSSPQEMIQAIRTGTVFPTNESPVGALWRSDRNNWGPRVGFAWDVRGDGRTSVRGGYGIGYERNFGNVTYNVLFNPPEFLIASIDVPTDVPSLGISSDPSGPFGGVAGVTKIIPRGSLRHVDQNIETAYAHFYGLSFQTETIGDLVARVEYTGSLGRKLYDLADPNKPGAPLVYLGVGGPFERATSQYTAFNTRGNRGRSEYNGITFALEARRMGNTGLQFSGSYTYGRAKDNLSSTFSDRNNNFNLGYLDAFDPMLDWGFADFDVRHRGVVSGIWAMPFFEERGGLARALLGDWQLNFIVSARTGFPFTVYDCENGLILCMRALDPVGIAKNATSGSSTGNPNEFRLLDLSRLQPYVGTYAHPVQGTSDFGPYPAEMTPRNAFRGPGYWNTDLGLSKRVRFMDRYAVQLRLEAYNVFNHPNLFPQVDYPSADVAAGEILGYKDGNRRMQVGAKFEF